MRDRASAHLVNLASPFEELESRHRANLETLSQLSLLVDVDFLGERLGELVARSR
jgi:hypothetical protein